VPGGPGSRERAGEEIVDWISSAHASTRWTASVCTGSLLLGAAGVLEGMRATSHWLFLGRLGDLGAEPTPQRVVREGKVITAAGVLGDRHGARARGVGGGGGRRPSDPAFDRVRPRAAFSAGSPGSAPDHVVELVRRAAARVGD
jgi:DJ-1/PfpI family protein